METTNDVLEARLYNTSAELRRHREEKKVMEIALAELVAAAEPFAQKLSHFVCLKAKDLAEGREVEETQALAAAVERAQKVLKP